MLYAFQEQTSDDTLVMLTGFGVVINALGIRAKTYLPQICGTIVVSCSVMGLHYMITFILYIPFPFIFYIH
jgi:hypothetical protein